MTVGRMSEWTYSNEPLGSPAEVHLLNVFGGRSHTRLWPI